MRTENETNHSNLNTGGSPARCNSKIASPQRLLAFAYYRLSREEAQSGESASISNQKKIVEAYCEQNDVVLVQSFADDGWSGGNFERPGFQSMMRALESRKANMVITKDLSRLGRDMRESSYYAEQFFSGKANPIYCDCRSL